MNYNWEEKYITQNGYEEAPGFVILAHELAHAYSYVKGFQDESLWFENNGNKVMKNEWYATVLENIIRGESSLPLRTHYDGETGDASRGYEKSRIVDSIWFYSFHPDKNLRTYWKPTENPSPLTKQ